MSGANIPYHLRPHKSIDRRLFLDLLMRYERFKPLHEAVYVSMGAYSLEDHKLIHRHLGIRRLIAFDYDVKIVQRQQFNRPIEDCKCVKLSSGDAVSDFDGLLARAGFEDAEGAIVWLDYTSPNQIGAQLREFQTLLDAVAPGDVIRVTVNAHPATLGEARNSDGSPKPREQLNSERLATLKERVGDYLPASISEDDVSTERLPVAISAAFATAAAKAFPPRQSRVFQPLSIVRYTDGQQMLSITGAVLLRSDVERMLGTLSLRT